MPHGTKTWVSIAGGMVIGSLSTFILSSYQTSGLEEHIEQLRADLVEAKGKEGGLHRQRHVAERAAEHFKADGLEVHKLRAQATELRQALAGQGPVLSNRTTASAPKGPRAAPSSVPGPEAMITELPVHFDSLEQLSDIVLELRTRAAAGQLTVQEQDWLNQLRPRLQQLEETPAEFARLQASVIASATGITDAERVGELRTVLQKTYDMALITGLDSPSRPKEDTEWRRERLLLDRRGTAAVQSLLSESERAAFDRGFASIMGIDLGTGLDKSLYPDGFIADGGTRH
jgi:hypothetical protein